MPFNSLFCSQIFKHVVHERGRVHCDFSLIYGVIPVLVEVAENGVAILIGERKINLEFAEKFCEETAQLLPVEDAVAVGIKLYEVLCDLLAKAIGIRLKHLELLFQGRPRLFRYSLNYGDRHVLH